MSSKEKSMLVHRPVSESLESGSSRLGSIFFLAALGLALVVCPAVRGQHGDGAPPAAAGIPILAVGSQAPDFSLPGVDGKTHSLKDYASSKVLAVVFTCNHCPVAQMYEKRIKELTANY